MDDETWWQRERLNRDRLDAKNLGVTGLKLLASVPAVILMAFAVIFSFKTPELVAQSVAYLACVYTLVGVTAGLVTISVGLLRYRRLSERVRTFDAPSPLPVARLVVRYARLDG